MKNKYVKKIKFTALKKLNKEGCKNTCTNNQPSKYFCLIIIAFGMKWSLKTTHAKQTKELKRN